MTTFIHRFLHKKTAYEVQKILRKPHIIYNLAYLLHIKPTHITEVLTMRKVFMLRIHSIRNFKASCIR